MENNFSSLEDIFPYHDLHNSIPFCFSLPLRHLSPSAFDKLTHGKKAALNRYASKNSVLGRFVGNTSTQQLSKESALVFWRGGSRGVRRMGYLLLNCNRLDRNSNGTGERPGRPTNFSAASKNARWRGAVTTWGKDPFQGRSYRTKAGFSKGPTFFPLDIGRPARRVACNTKLFLREAALSLAGLIVCCVEEWRVSRGCYRKEKKGKGDVELRSREMKLVFHSKRELFPYFYHVTELGFREANNCF